MHVMDAVYNIPVTEVLVMSASQSVRFGSIQIRGSYISDGTTTNFIR